MILTFITANSFQSVTNSEVTSSRQLLPTIKFSLHDVYGFVSGDIMQTVWDPHKCILLTLTVQKRCHNFSGMDL